MHRFVGTLIKLTQALNESGTEFALIGVVTIVSEFADVLENPLIVERMEWVFSAYPAE